MCFFSSPSKNNLETQSLTDMALQILPTIARAAAWFLRAAKWSWSRFRTVLVWLGILAAQKLLIEDLWEDVFERVDGLVTGYSAESVNFQPLSLMNAFFPLSELLSMVTSYAAVVSACIATRIVVAFINARKA